MTPHSAVAPAGAAVGPAAPDGSTDATRVPAEDVDDVRTALEWARGFLATPHEDLGRKGPVCPYIRHSFDEHLVHAVTRPETSCADPELRRAVSAARHTFTALRGEAPRGHQHLVSVLVVLPRIDRTSAVELEELHRDLKDEFVAEGLMIGQFHPECQARGLWSADFRPLQSPVPLLAIREMVSSDLPFLIGRAEHADVYFERYAAAIPAHTRRFLVDQLVRSEGVPS